MRARLKGAALTLADRLLSGFGAAPVVVLAFHAVPDRALFAAQLDALAGLGWPVVGLDEVVRWQTSEAGLASPMLALTFDDGRCDQVEHAVPELRRRGWPTTFFVMADRRDQPAGWPEETGGTASFPLADADAIRRLAAWGFTVGCHARTRRSLAGLDPHTLASEVVGARLRLSDLLRQEVRWFCYPYGHHDARAVAAVRAAGFAGACTTVPAAVRRPGDPWRLPRMTVPPHALPVEVRAYARGTVLGYRRARDPVRRLRRRLWSRSRS